MSTLHTDRTSPTAGLALDQAEAGQEVTGGKGLACGVDPLLEEADRHVGDLLTARIDRGERGPAEARFVDVVEADDGDVLWDSYPRLLKGPHRSEGDEVIERDDAVEGGASLQEAAHRVGAGAAEPSDDVDDQRGVVGHTGVSQRLPVADKPQTGGAVLEGGIGAQGHDPATSLLEEVSGGRS